MNLLRDRVPARPGTGCPGYARRFDGWAASYDCSPLQTVLYGPSMTRSCGMRDSTSGTPG